MSCGKFYVYLLYPSIIEIYITALTKTALPGAGARAGGSFQSSSTWEEVRVSVHRPVVSTYQHYQHYNTAAHHNNNKRVKYEGRTNLPTVNLRILTDRVGIGVGWDLLFEERDDVMSGGGAGPEPARYQQEVEKDLSRNIRLQQM